MSIKSLQQHLINLALLISCLVLLSACTYSASDAEQSAGLKEDPQEETILLQGTAVKGVISNGIINVFSGSTEPQNLITSTTTNLEGQFSMTLPESTIDKLTIIELTVNDSSLMRCDLILGCEEYNSGRLIPFGESLQLPSHFKLLGAIFKSEEAESRAFLSPLSHIIVSIAQSLPEGLTNQSIETVAASITQSFNLSFNPLLTNTADITSLTDISNISDEQLKQGVLSAALYKHALDPEWSNGNISLDTLPIADVLEDAALLAEQLAESISHANHYSQALLTISQETQAQSESLNSSKLTIQTQPASISVKEGEAFSLFVLTSGAGPIQYQWTKNNTNIQQLSRKAIKFKLDCCPLTGNFSRQLIFFSFFN